MSVQFVVSTTTFNYGYQEAHRLYDEMQHFFAQKASLAHQEEVVVIKIIIILLKPYSKNPHIVSVHS
jgi:hypothetical protein